MPSVVATSNGGIGPPVWRNEKWGFVVTDPNEAYDAAEIDVYLDKLNVENPPRVQLTQLDSGVTVTATTVEVDMPTEWVSENLTAGRWRVALLVNGYRRAWWYLDVLTPEAGDFTPGGGSSS